MQLTTLLLLHLLALTSYATTSTKVTATFDNIPGGFVAATDPSPGTYQYITYNSFVVANQSLSLVGITAQSKPNVIDTGSRSQMMTGTPSLRVAKPYTSFGLTDFYFGCVSQTQTSAADLPLQCTVTVAGFISSMGKEVALASFTFTPPEGETLVPLVHAVLPSSFLNSGIVNVTIIQDNPVTEALAIDNIGYYLYK